MTTTNSLKSGESGLNSSNQNDQKTSLLLDSEQDESILSDGAIVNASNSDTVPKDGSIPPVVYLIMFAFVNFLSYLDRGVLSGSLEDISRELGNVSDANQGLLGSAFMGGYMIASPIFAQLVNRYDAFTVMGIGLALWVSAVTICGLGNVYWVVLIGRLLTGFGEAGFLCIAPPFIDKVAPNGKKAVWLSVFYTCIPVGYACGFILSGVWLEKQPFGVHNSWRSLFWMEAMLMFPFVVIALIKKSPHSFKKEPAPEQQELLPSSGESNAVDLNRKPKNAIMTYIHIVVMHKVLILSILGYAMQTFVTGGLAFFGMNYAKQHLGMSKSSAGLSFGAVTVVTGIFGTLSGGILIDKLRRRACLPSVMHKDYKFSHDLTNSNTIKDRITSLVLGLQICAGCTLAAAPFALCSFILPGKASFLIFLFFAEFLLFMCYSPINNTIMWQVPFKFTPFAVAWSVIVMHALGDAASPPLIGALRDHTSWHTAMVTTSIVLFVAGGIWTVPMFIMKYWQTKLEIIEFHEQDFLTVDNTAATSVEMALPHTKEAMEVLRGVRKLMKWDIEE